MYQMTTDNRTLTDRGGRTGRAVTVDWSAERMEYMIRRRMNWRTPTKRYDTFRQRMSCESSYVHDGFIEWMLATYPDEVKLLA